MRALVVAALLIASASLALPTPAGAQDTPAPSSSTWLLVPLVSSSPKLGTSGGALVGFAKTFDPASKVSIFGIIYQFTTTHSDVGSVFARTSFGADHHRIVAIGAFGLIKNDYQDYLGTGQPLQTNDDLRAFVGRYLYRAAGSWFLGAEGRPRTIRCWAPPPKMISSSTRWAFADSRPPRSAPSSCTIRATAKTCPREGGT